MTLEALKQHCLKVVGGFHTTEKDHWDFASCLLIGLDEPGFWPHFTTQPEYTDGLPNPMDRWSKRVLRTIAEEMGGKAVFPSDGPPFAPFYQWALRSGRCHVSPVNMLVHVDAGLFISFRGAITLPDHVDHPMPLSSPCHSCAERLCTASCPVGALTPQGYDPDACKAFLRTPEGHACRTTGCAVRKSCPASQRFGRMPEQSEFHMKAFLDP